MVGSSVWGPTPGMLHPLRKTNYNKFEKLGMGVEGSWS